jgi:hypothetical protein
VKLPLSHVCPQLVARELDGPDVADAIDAENAGGQQEYLLLCHGLPLDLTLLVQMV